MFIMENVSSAKKKMKQKKYPHDDTIRKQKLFCFDILLGSLCFSALFYMVKGNLYTHVQDVS